MRDVADDTVSAIIEKWSTAFRRLDADALSSFYSKHAFFFGSNPRLYRGRDGVKAYFNGLPRWASPTVRFTDRAATLVNPDLINSAATASFVVEEGTPPLLVKITWVIVREDGIWKIASHHVSSTTPLIEQ
ncbi:MAG TPA: nuclear transport factor 2 family protein [Bradyrhizobium sp.]|uniref:YybH family protein n=1 Tax=Bradyrhizobium sp. TaxID=376 RepID=UPI002C72C94B|nr:nuclear transport factor 2 family protein [Bradyrhizobium sp.]HTB02607.1 nuclear transport factor 2 family protein [Bradyrhizobium sp.]